MPDPIFARPVEGGVELDMPDASTYLLTLAQVNDLIDALDAARGAEA